MSVVAYLFNSFAWMSVGYVAAVLERRLRLIDRAIERINRRLDKMPDGDEDEPT